MTIALVIHSQARLAKAGEAPGSPKGILTSLADFILVAFKFPQPQSSEFSL